MSDYLESLRPKSRRFRATFYYMKWVNVLSILGVGYAGLSGYIPMSNIIIFCAPIMFEHLILYVLRWNEDQEWERYFEASAKEYEKKASNRRTD